MITVNNRMNVIAGDWILIPGMEPASTTSSPTMAYEMRKAGYDGPALISLKRALEVVPGSSVIICNNYNSPTQKLFVLPDVQASCPGCCYPDWYNIMRLAAEVTNQATIDNICGVLSQGFCQP